MNRKDDRIYTHMIQEQGDLGLGAVEINKKYKDKNGNVSIPNSKFTGFSRPINNKPTK